MRTARSTLPALLLAAACAHAPAPGDLPVSSAASGIEVRADGVDDRSAAQVAEALPAAIARVERWGALPRPIVVRIQPSAEALAASAGRPGDTWLRGWARRGSVEIQAPRTWSRGPASDGAVATLLTHELSHCLLFARLPGDWTRRDVPPWFEEGMASYTAGERHDRADAAVLAPRTPGTASIPGAVATADPAVLYGTADRAFRRLVALHGEASVRAILAELAAGRRFPAAFLAATGTPLVAFESALRRDLEASASR
ncbi:MAG TPA: hypothetical protein VFM45_03400 [Anaeromyxobacteraceae bacterium]|nr:hypothetical protein [Anaeromyxobacteraceae bacterium]